MLIKHRTSTLTEQSFAQFIADKYNVGVNIETSDKGYTLWWTDFVANEWYETYSNLSALLLRLSVLIYCAESNWDAGFSENDPRALEIIASRFFSTQTN